MKFQVLQGGQSTRMDLSNVVFMDSDGTMSDPQVKDAVKNLTNAYLNYGIFYVAQDLNDCPVGEECYGSFREAFSAAGNCGIIEFLPGAFNNAATLSVGEAIVLGSGMKMIVMDGNAILD